MPTLADHFQQIAPANTSDPDYVPGLVDAILTSARQANATDIHLLPTATGMRMDWRIDGVLQHVTTFDVQFSTRIAARLKVLSGLLTYRTDVPQEGRISASANADETRISTFPTLHGEKAVVRLFAADGQYERIEQLGLPDDITPKLKRLLTETSGVILLTGPAGSGKTTTIYASLREIVDESRGGRSLVSLEDPIEVVVPGVAQSQVNNAVGFNLDTGLRSLMRQDPEVIMVGEIRDRATAETVFQASLTGHLVITTFHAGSAAGAISRLLDMGIEPYLLRSSLRAILSQRLMRKLCQCAKPQPVAELPTQIDITTANQPVGCTTCADTGYAGRMLLAEMIEPADKTTGQAIMAMQDTAAIHSAAVDAGMISQRARAVAAIEAGLTSIDEAIRILGRELTDTTANNDT